MSEYFGGDYLHSTLIADTALQALLGQYTDGLGTLQYPIFNARMVPIDCTVKKTLNMYRLDPYDASLEYFESRWSIDCRGDTQTDSETIAESVMIALNRVHTLTTGKTYFGTVSILSTIPPADETDQYNTSVQVLIRRK